ncbi:MAG: hypothetical protein CMN76_08445 [Spirochaetaceae bacterium]|nr:hypothetical protein [Spirochaetaceae bacterium]|tara:strand:- start:11395 stop:12399 length:1005 start_codon:yes stop_codon:yes gene_type:complete
MGSYARALSITFRMFMGITSHGKHSRITLNGRSAIRVLPESGRVRATVMVVHGMAARGNEDPRIQVLASAYAANGYEVIVPDYREIRGLRIDPGSIKRVEQDIIAIAKLEDRGPVGIFSASFSGSLSMVAASGKAADRVRAMLLLGPFGHVMSVVEHLFDAEDRDPYGFFVVLKNFLPGKSKKVQELRKCFEEAALDNGLQRSPRLLPARLANLRVPVRREFYRILNDAQYRRKIKDQIMNDPTVRKIASRIDAISHCPDIQASVTLIHGDRDNVIPPGESRLLFDHLRDQVPTRICLTPLISHGSPQVGMDLPLRVHQVVSAISFFLKQLEGR